MVAILCTGLFCGYIKLPWDFNSSEEAKRYVLSKLMDKYNETFVFIEEPQYKEEKIDIHWIRGR